MAPITDNLFENHKSPISDEEAVSLFKEILRFETVSSLGPENGSYDACAQWILRLCAACGVKAFIIPESKPHKPIVVAEWVGSDASLPCIFLNSHYDVVPAAEDSWEKHPFAAVEKNGVIYGRGAQDMKCVCVQYLVALQRLRIKWKCVAPRRTVRLSWVPDEEIGGLEGMELLLKSTWFNEIPVGIALDEGLASENDSYSVFYGERLPWWIKVTATGNTGHASRFIEGTAVEQVLAVATRALKFRLEQKEILHGTDQAHNCSHSVAAKKSTLGDVTSLNITRIHTGGGGVEAYNVVPEVCEMGMDIRISPNIEPCEMKDTIERWCQESESAITGLPAAGGIKWEYHINKGQKHTVTSTETSENPWWGIFTTCLKEKCGSASADMIFPAATDSRFLRALGIKAIGFSPMKNSPILLHEHNECLDKGVYLEGCQVYENIFSELFNQERLPCD